MLRHLPVPAATVAAFSIAGPAVAQDPAKCQPMTLMSDNVDRSIQHIDVHKDGGSRGDWRIGYRRLLDGDGNEIGYRRWVAVALNAPPGEKERSEIIANLILKLPDGQIHVQNLVDAARPVDATEDSVLADKTQATGVVIGGTGAYLFARGAYASERNGETRTYTLNIKCN